MSDLLDRSGEHPACPVCGQTEYITEYKEDEAKK